MPTSWRAWFAGTRLRFDADVEGNRVTAAGMLLGMGAGPTHGDPGVLLHEMAHFVEIDDARCLVWGWGLRVPTVEVAGRMCEQPTSFACCLREVRVMALQCALGRHFGLEQDPAELAQLLSWVPGVWHGAAHYGADGRLTAHELFELAARDIEARAAEVDVGSVWGEWRRKCALHDAAFPGVDSRSTKHHGSVILRS